MTWSTAPTPIIAIPEPGIDTYIALTRNEKGQQMYHIDVQDGPGRRWRTRWANMTLRRALMHYDCTVLMPGWRKRIVCTETSETLCTSDREVSC